MSTTSQLTVCHPRVQTLLKLQTGSGSLGQFWHLHRGLQSSFSAVQTLGKGLRPPTGLCRPQVEHPALSGDEDSMVSGHRGHSHLCYIKCVVGRTAPLTHHIYQSSKLEYTNPLQKSLMWVPGASYSKKNRTKKTNQKPKYSTKKKGKQNSPVFEIKKCIKAPSITRLHITAAAGGSSTSLRTRRLHLPEIAWNEQHPSRKPGSLGN